MAALVGIDAKIELSTVLDTPVWQEISERNEFSISVDVEVAEHKVFVTSLSAAWVTKARTWMSWSGSLNGYYDDGDDLIFETVVAGATVKLRFFDTRNDANKYWIGNAILTSVEHTTGTDDFATLSVDFEGQGALSRVTNA